MRSSGQSASSSPRRRALHERSQSQSNETSPLPSLRLVKDSDNDNDNGQDQDELDVYSASPFPTRPQHVLLPQLGKGQAYIQDLGFHVDEPSTQSTATLTSTSRAADSSFLDQSLSDPWDLSSTIDAANSPSQVWEDDPTSSKSSLPEPDLPGEKSTDNKSDNGSIAAYSDEGMNVLPLAPTIKTVFSETPSSSRQPSGSQIAPSGSSSPNLVTIGSPSSLPSSLPSSPNFVAFDSSSVNFVRIGTSSNPDSASRADSLTSWNSMGTVIRHVGAAPWTTHGSSSEEQASSRSQSFRSNPPYHSSARSNSISTSRRGRSHSRSMSSRSGPPSDIQAVVDNGVFIQYPTIRGPSFSSSWVDPSQTAGSSDHDPQDLTADRSSDRPASHLSTVTSRWSAEYEPSFVSQADELRETTPSEPFRPHTALVRQRQGSSSLWLVNGSDSAEQLDDLSNLPARPSNPGVPSSSSSESRTESRTESRRSSVRSDKRPGTSSSFAGFNMIPTWAKMYYRSEGQVVKSAAVGSDRPSTARGAAANPNPNPTPLPRVSTALSRTRTLTNETRGSVQSKAPRDSFDPRSHWVRGAEPGERTWIPGHRLRHSWSPHLYPDRRVVRPKASRWAAPSLDSRTEPLLGRRNIQVWSFCLGFIFPPAWFIASFLPLPSKPNMASEQSGAELEMALKTRLDELERRRYDNAKWWRNLNRWMTPLGLVIITIIVILAAVGTTVGF